MYKIFFLQYNELTNEVLSEEDTLKNIYDLVLEQKPTREENEALKSTKDWAKFAYEKEKEYHIIVFQNDKLFAYINNSFMDISVNFLTFNRGEIFKHLTMIYDKYDMDIAFNEDRNEKFPNEKLFLSQINNYYEDDEKKIQRKLIFKLNSDCNIFANTFDKRNNNLNTEAKKTKVNISHNFIRNLQHYKDYEYLLDYKNILKPEYLDF